MAGTGGRPYFLTTGVAALWQVTWRCWGELEHFMLNGLYLITDHQERLLERVELALSGGVSCLQYRNKVKGYPARCDEARDLQALCSRFGVTFIVNDDLALAAEVGADG
ncbi:MAG TPA: thiamine phosphate synthase, partial [Geobacteraceae bacterium]|nr:thiamine phosphate synthase [Geobacteraceae bacterium]